VQKKEMVMVTRRRAGFTLIELLVVIAIIAILAAILFPVFARARSKAQENTCLSNCKQMALAANMYVTDYDNTVFPYYYAQPPSRPAGYLDFYWTTLISPYVKNNQIFVCPSDAVPGGRIPDPNYGGACCGTYAPGTPPTVSYCMNAIIGSGNNFGSCNSTGQNNGFYGNPVLTLEQVDDASRTILFFDENDAYNGGDWAPLVVQAYATDFAPIGSPSQPTIGTGSTAVSSVHFGGYNASFIDGHAKYFLWGWENSSETNWKAWVSHWYSSGTCP
jgi:prepilin-type N-terminal cleavage/methylation domain-containing protein